MSANAHTLTTQVLDRLSACGDARLREVTASLVRHLHAFVAEVRPTDAEWLAGVEFLTRTGQMCDGKRQEFILLSDTLGVSMLVDLLNHGADDGATDTTVLGPFFVPDQPLSPPGSSILKRPEEGVPVLVEGRVLSPDGTPLAGARIDVWQTAPDGLYDVQAPDCPPGHLRAAFLTGEDGAYRFESILPASYPIPTDGPVGQLLTALGRHPFRPAHIHFMIRAEGHADLVTHLFLAGDRYLESDAVFGVKPSLIVSPVAGEDGSRRLVHHFVLRGV